MEAAEAAAAAGAEAGELAAEDAELAATLRQLQRMPLANLSAAAAAPLVKLLSGVSGCVPQWGQSSSLPPQQPLGSAREGGSPAPRCLAILRSRSPPLAVQCTTHDA